MRKTPWDKYRSHDTPLVDNSLLDTFSVSPNYNKVITHNFKS
jgi:hypothetical protein